MVYERPRTPPKVTVLSVLIAPVSARSLMFAGGHEVPGGMLLQTEKNVSTPHGASSIWPLSALATSISAASVAAPFSSSCIGSDEQATAASTPTTRIEDRMVFSLENGNMDNWDNEIR